MNRIPISVRLIGAFVLLALVGAGIGAVGVLGTARMNARAQVTYEQDLTGLKFTARAESALIATTDALARAQLALDPGQRTELVDAAIQTEEEVKRCLDQATPLFDNEQGRGLAALAAASFEQYHQAFQELVADLRNAGKGESAAARGLLLGPYGDAVVPVRTALHAMVEWKVSSAKTNADDNRSVFHESTGLIVALTLGAVACAIGLGIVLARSISRPLAAAIEVADAVARGDLTTEIVASGSDELAHLQQALETMVLNLRKLVASVRVGVDSVAVSSSQIASGNEDLSTRTEQQASSLEQTAASMEQLSSTVKQNTASAQQANQLAAAASEVAGRSGEAVGQVVDTMGRIQESSRKIAEIIGVIDGIAFQTNILALNAAVEAARAGEQGRGFAVVAGEVRNLAQRSAQAAREIKSLIADSVEKVENGSRQVAEAGKTMNDLVSQVRRVTDLLNGIATATLEQNSGIGQVNTAVTQLDTMTQQNAALVEQSAAAAASLREQATRLAQAVAIFKLGQDESRRAIAAAQATARDRVKLTPAASVSPETPAARKPDSKPSGGAKPEGKSGGKSDWEEF